MPRKYTTDLSSGRSLLDSNARIAAACAMASISITPGMIGWWGKCPGKNGSLIVTFLSARMRLPTSHSSTRSMSRNG